MATAVLEKEKVESFRDFFRDPKRLSSISKTLPKHMEPERFANVAINAAIKNPALLDCSMATIYSSVIQAAELGLVPNTALGLCWLIPFERRAREGNNWVSIKECQLIIGYAGYVDLMYRSGQICAVSGFLSYKGDDFSVRYGTSRSIEHAPKFLTLEDEDVEFAYVVVDTVRGGAPIFKVMSIAEINEHRQFSKSGALGKTQRDGSPIEAKGPWVDNFASMALKTPLRSVQPWVPKSAEMSKLLSLERANEINDYSALEFSNEMASPANAALELGGTSARVAGRVAKATSDAPKIDPNEIPFLLRLGMNEDEQRDWTAYCEGNDLKQAAIETEAEKRGIKTKDALYDLATAMDL